MKLTCSVFENTGKIPSEYTCDGENISPELHISEVPQEAKSLVLLMDDPDIPDFVKERAGVKKWDHWTVFNIAPTTEVIAKASVPQGALQGKNTGGNNAYGGPCPPDTEHRYFFKLYALDLSLDLPEGSTMDEVENAMAGHILAETELMGRYERIQ